tara:strand:+ start:31 stop:375 length:345 start_codon:yes stop_codon:yes gene_type:complete
MTKYNNTFLFNLICDDLIEEIMKYIKWFKHIDKKYRQVTIHRLNFIKEPKLDYNVSIYYFDNTEKNYWLKIRNKTYVIKENRFFQQRNRKFKTNKKGLLQYNFDYKKFTEIKYI